MPNDLKPDPWTDPPELQHPRLLICASIDELYQSLHISACCVITSLENVNPLGVGTETPSFAIYLSASLPAVFVNTATKYSVTLRSAPASTSEDVLASKITILKGRFSLATP